jgi:aspartyl-tRNA(Asn)/glutamyl-tRNA(Gln) amidotransferase subunit C
MSKSLSRDYVIKVARLAKLKLTDKELDRFATEINEIIKYVNHLQEADVKHIKPTDQVTGLVNVWRDDKEIDYGYKPEDLLKNVPETENSYIKVNRMI